jgi:hypothetical protein
MKLGPVQGAACRSHLEALPARPVTMPNRPVEVVKGGLLSASAPPRTDDWETMSHDRGRCAMYGVCGVRPDGDLLDCSTNKKAPDAEPEARRTLSLLCPSLWADSGVMPTAITTTLE